MFIAWLDRECLSVYFSHPQLVWFAFICLLWVLSPDLFWESLLTWLCALQMPLIAAESDRAYNGGPLDGKYYQHSSFTPLEAGLVQEGTDFLMEEYTFRLSVLYFKDLGQLDKSLSEQLPSWIEGLVQDGHLQNAHASLLQALHGAYPAYGLTVKWVTYTSYCTRLKTYLWNECWNCLRILSRCMGNLFCDWSLLSIMLCSCKKV